MKKCWALWALLAAATALHATDTPALGKEDVLDAFKKYNPAALQKAEIHAQYGDLLNKLAASYTAPRSEENYLELIALVKNFDNSIRLQAAKNNYIQGRTLQQVSATTLPSLQADTQAEILDLVQDIYHHTLEVKEIQTDLYKARLKSVKKDKSLSLQDKKKAVRLIKEQIQQTKAEIKSFKKDSKQKIQETAAAYFEQIRLDYEASLSAEKQQTQRSEQAQNLSVTHKNKKPVAK